MFCKRTKIPVAFSKKGTFSQTKNVAPEKLRGRSAFVFLFFVLLLLRHDLLSRAFVEGGCFVVDVLYRFSEASSPRK